MLILLYTGLTILMHTPLDSQQLRGLVFLLEGVLALGGLLQYHVLRTWPSPGASRWTRWGYRASGLVVPLLDLVGWIIYSVQGAR